MYTVIEVRSEGSKVELCCLLLETGTSTLDECAETINTFGELEKLAGTIHEKYANSERISDLRWKRKMGISRVKLRGTKFLKMLVCSCAMP
jgi:hypothetical protein